jgi:hypothetical protein
MKSIIALVVGLMLATGLSGAAHADIGWSEARYAEEYGPGNRGYGKVNARSYPIGDSVLVVEFDDEGVSTGELWVLGTVRSAIPAGVLAAAETAEQGERFAQVNFKAKSALPCEIREAYVDDVLVRVDVRNQLTYRIAFCGRKPSCGLWRRIFGPPCETAVSCGILDRALAADRTMDEFHVRAERAVERSERAGQAHQHDEGRLFP